jgi:hypothetical protein
MPVNVKPVETQLTVNIGQYSNSRCKTNGKPTYVDYGIKRIPDVEPESVPEEMLHCPIVSDDYESITT